MKPRYLIGVDLGTSATKAALYDADARLLAEATEALTLTNPAPGRVEQEQEDFYRTAAQTVSRVITESGIDPAEIAALGFDSQMAGIGSVDEDYRPATRYDSWLDMRCEPYIEELVRDHGDRITELTGGPPTCAHAAKMLWWKHERPDEYARIARFVTPSAFVAGRLAGLKGGDAFMDHTFLHFTGCSDAAAGTWSVELCDRLGLDIERLPRVVEPWEVVGEAKEDQAKAFGLRPGTPVVAGAGDTAASALGAGLVRPGMMLDVAGTASVFAGSTGRFAADVGHRTLLVMRSIVPGLWHPLAFVGGGGLALDWFAAQFAGSDEGSPRAKLDALLEEAGKVAPGADGLFFSPHLGGRICPADPGRRGNWQGFSWGHTRAHFFRAVLESIAFEYARYLEVIEELVPEHERREARVCGGGARGTVWNGIKADVLGVSWRRLPRDDIATLGVALVAGHAAGVVPDIAAAAERASQPAEGAIEPSASAHAAYEPIVRDYVAWQKNLDRM